MALTKEDQALSANVGRSGCGFEDCFGRFRRSRLDAGWGSDGGCGQGRDAEFCVFTARRRGGESIRSFRDEKTFR